MFALIMKSKLHMACSASREGLLRLSYCRLVVVEDGDGLVLGKPYIFVARAMESMRFESTVKVLYSASAVDRNRVLSILTVGNMGNMGPIP
jgi:hypothetical protein